MLTWRNLSPADLEAVDGEPPDDFDWSTATGPVTKLRVVGVVRLPMESVVSFASTGLLLPSPAWAAGPPGRGRSLPDRHGGAGWVNALVRLRHGAADVPAFQAGVARLYGRDDIPVKDLRDDIKRVQRSLDVERTALLLFAVAVVLAAIVLIGQAIVRSVRSGSDVLPVLRAIGFDRPGLTAGLMLPHVLAVAIGGVTAAITAVALSARFPIGLGRDLDPNVGVHINGPLLAVGVALTVAALGLGCLLAAWSTVRRVGRAPSHRQDAARRGGHAGRRPGPRRRSAPASPSSPRR